MPLTSNFLRPQVHVPLWEKLTDAPAVSAATSVSCCADNSNFHAQHGRYIYYLMAAASFYRYDTWTNTYEQLADCPLTPLTWSSMRFAGAKGFENRVIASPTTSKIQVGVPFGQVGKTFDIRITDGTGKGQRRIITDVSDPVIADVGSATGGAVTSITDTNKNWTINQWVGYVVRVTTNTGAGQVRKILYNDATSITISNAAKYPEEINCNVQWVAPVAGSIYQIESCIITVDTAFGTQPDATSRFLIESGVIYYTTSLATAFYVMAAYDVLMDIWYIRSTSSGIIGITGTDGALERNTENASIWDRGIATATGSDGTHLADTTKNWKVNQWAGYYVRVFTGTSESTLKKIDSNTSTILTWTGSVTAPDATSRYLIVGFDAGTCSGASVAESANSASITAAINQNVLNVSAVGAGVIIPGQILSGPCSVIRMFTNATSSGAVVTVGSTTNVHVGMVMTMVSGTGTLAAGVTTVVNVLTATTFTISQTPGTPLSSTNCFMLGGSLGNQTLPTATSCSSSGTTITVSSTTNFQVGMACVVTAGTGDFNNGGIITSITDGTHFVVSIAPGTQLSGATISATFPLTTIVGAQLTGATPGGTGTYLVYPQQIVASSTFTASGLALLVDSSKSTWPVNRWNNLMVRITGGLGKGQIRMIQATIPGYFSVTPDWTTALDSSSTYEIQGDIDKMYLMLGGNSSTYIHNLNCDILTTGRQESYGSAGGVFAQYADHPPIAISGGVYANPTMTITTVNPHNYKTGMLITHYGDVGVGKTLNNIQAAITVTGANTYTYSVGAGSASMTVPAQSTSTLVDSIRNWAPNQWAGCIVTYNVVVPTQASGTVATYAEYIIGNNATTLFFARVGTVPVQGITRYSITQNFMCPSKNAVGAFDAGLAVNAASTVNDATHIADTVKGWTSAATNCTSSGTNITVGSGMLTKGLLVGMYVTVSGGTGAFSFPTKVVSITSDTVFVVDTTPTITLSAATVTASFWPPNSLNGRRLKILAGAGYGQEVALTASTFSSATCAITTMVTGSSVYEIVAIPVRGLGIELNWLFGTSDTNKKGSWMIIPRGTSVQIDRLNIQTDTWEMMHTVPMRESFTTGTQWAYDGGDKIFIVVNGTLRMLYLDVNTGILHGGMMLPYSSTTAIIGNRAEVFTTADGLKYLWTNVNQSGKECFRALIFW